MSRTINALQASKLGVTHKVTSRVCHSLMCNTLVNGNVGTYCDKCKTPKITTTTLIGRKGEITSGFDKVRKFGAVINSVAHIMKYEGFTLNEIEDNVRDGMWWVSNAKI